MKRTILILIVFVIAIYTSCAQSQIQSLVNLPVAEPTATAKNTIILSPAEQRLKSDLSVVTLGTGSPAYNAKRSGPSTMVKYDDKYFLIDMGNGTQARMAESGIPFEKISALILTHHHLDHNEELVPLVIQSWLRKGSGMTLIGPPGTRELYDFIEKFYREDITYRATRTGREFGGSLGMDIRELAGGEIIEIHGVSIHTRKVAHSIQTIAYRFDAGGKSIVISGDTAYSEDLIVLAGKADILVMDSGAVIMKNRDAQQQSPLPRNKMSSATAKQDRAHPTLQDVAVMAEKAGVKMLVLTHFGTGEVDKESTSREIESIYHGTVIFGEDLMEIICP